MDDLKDLCLFYNGQELSPLVRKHFMNLFENLVVISRVSFNSDLELSHPFAPTEKADKDILKCTNCDLVVRYCDTALYSGSNGTPEGCDLGRGLVTFHVREHVEGKCVYQRVQIIRVTEKNHVTPSALAGLYTDAAAVRKAEKEGCQALARLQAESKEMAREEMVAAFTRAVLKAQQAGFAYLKELSDSDIVKTVKELAAKKDLTAQNLMALITPNPPMPLGSGKAAQVRSIKGGSRYHIRGGSGQNTLTAAVPYDRAALLLDANVMLLPAHLVGGAFEVPESVEKATKDVTTWVQETARKTGQTTSDIWKKFTAYIRGESQSNSVDKAVKTVKDTAKTATDNVKDASKKATDAIDSAAKKTIDTVKDLGDKTGVNEAVQGLATKTTEGINKATADFGESINAVIIPVSDNVAALLGKKPPGNGEIPVTSATASAAPKTSSRTIRGGNRSSSHSSSQSSSSNRAARMTPSRRTRDEDSDTPQTDMTDVSSIHLTSEQE